LLLFVAVVAVGAFLLLVLCGPGCYKLKINPGCEQTQKFFAP